MHVSPLLALDSVNLSLGAADHKVPILHDIHLHVDSGEHVAIVGPSGSGKTSLLMLIAGLERATSGRVTVAGTDFGTSSEDALAVARRNTVGIVFQAFHLVPSMTALENVLLPLEFQGDPHGTKRAKEMLDAVGLGHRLAHYPSELSGGEQQRVALARALAGRPALLLADEPTGNLDQETGAQIVELLFRLLDDSGGTLLLITHDPALAARCGRTVKLADGRIV